VPNFFIVKALVRLFNLSGSHVHEELGLVRRVVSALLCSLMSVFRRSPVKTAACKPAVVTHLMVFLSSPDIQDQHLTMFRVAPTFFPSRADKTTDCRSRSPATGRCSLPTDRAQTTVSATITRRFSPCNMSASPLLPMSAVWRMCGLVG